MGAKLICDLQQEVSTIRRLLRHGLERKETSTRLTRHLIRGILSVIKVEQ